MVPVSHCGWSGAPTNPGRVSVADRHHPPSAAPVERGMVERDEQTEADGDGRRSEWQRDADVECPPHPPGDAHRECGRQAHDEAEESGDEAVAERCTDGEQRLGTETHSRAYLGAPEAAPCADRPFGTNTQRVHHECEQWNPHHQSDDRVRAANE